jgi:uncharacterized membrane protein YgcG
MKKIIKGLILVITIFATQNVFAERINSFNSDIVINEDASITVVESIQYNFENAERHGIFRFIPLQYMVNGPQGEDGNVYRMDISLVSVERNGLAEPFIVEYPNNQVSIKIGNASRKITGNHAYTITYQTTGALRYFDSYDELYWNATGTEWEVPIDMVSVSLKSDTVMFNNFFCYTGAVNSQNACEQKNNNANILFFSENNLDAKQGLTVAASFGKSLVPVVQNQVKISQKDSLIFTLLKIFSYFSQFLILMIPLLIFIPLYFFKRKHYYKRSITTQYQPIKDLNPMFTGYVMDLRFDPHDITAGIIYAAQQGYLQIEYVPKTNWYSSDDYIFTINRKKYESTKDIPEDIMFIISLIFRKGDYQDFSALFKNSNELLSVEFMTQRRLNDLKTESKKRLSEKNKTIKYFEKNLIEKKMLEKARFILGKKIRLTGKGWDTKFYLQGFRRFLSMTEKDRYEFFNNIKNPSQTFMEYLPYAIAFRVEKKWAGQFKDITIEQPDWYTGNQPGSLALASSLNSFSKAITSSVTPPKRSGSGSGSSGGGSSGGGSGGGGGGSW